MTQPARYHTLSCYRQLALLALAAALFACGRDARPYAASHLDLKDAPVSTAPHPASSAAPSLTPPGLWLAIHKDTQNTSRADVPGRGLARPKEFWHWGTESFSPTALRALDVAGRPCFLAQAGWEMRLLRENGSPAWASPLIGPAQVLGVWSTPAGPRILARWGVSGVTLIDAATGTMLWRRIFDQGFIGAVAAPHADGFRLYLAPANSTSCLCLQWDSPADAAPRTLWERDYAPRYYANFGPLLALGDMNRDGRDELVLVSKPTYVAVIDTDTGEPSFDLHYPLTDGPEDTGRPYGMVQLVDLDGDGYLDLFIAPNRVEEYYAVIHNEAGKGLRCLWSRFVEKDFPEDHRELRPTATSLTDLNGDGKPELVLSLFNMAGDGRWHTLVLDPLVGDARPLHDWPDRVLWGCFTLGDDPRPRVVVGKTNQRDTAGPTLLEARDGATGAVVASVDHVAPVTRLVASGSLTPYRGGNLGERREPILVAGPGKEPPALLVAEAPSSRVMRWSLREGRSVLKPAPVSRAARLLLDSASETPGPARTPLDFHIAGVNDRNDPKPIAALVAPSGQSGNPSIKKHTLILWMSDNTLYGGRLSSSNQLIDPVRLPGIQPALWPGPDGRRVLCAMHPTDEAVLIYDDLRRSSCLRIDLPLPLQRRFSDRGVYQSALVPFTVDGQMRLVVPLVTGRDTVAAALYDEQGKLLWIDREHGIFPHPPAVYDLNADGRPDLLFDDHGRQAIYQLDGSSRLFAQAWHDTVPGRADGAALALPIVGPFGPGGAIRMVMAPGYSAFEVNDAQGRRLARRAFAGAYDYYFTRPAIGRRGPGPDASWTLGVVHRAGRLEWIDAEDLHRRASADLGAPILPGSKVVACDLDGDGTDEFLVALSTGQLIAAREVAGRGEILWKIELESEVLDFIAADVDGSGKTSFIVTLANGKVRIFR